MTPMKPNNAFVAQYLKAAASDTSLKAMLSRLPIGRRNRYESVLQRPYFTRADLWNETKEDAELTQIHAFLNEQSHAHLVGAGVHAITTADTPVAKIDEELQREVMFAQDRGCLNETFSGVERTITRTRLGTPEENTRQFDEALQSGNSAPLTAPALSLLSLLSVEQVIELKAEAHETIFDIALRHSNWGSAESFMAAYVPACEEYSGADVGEDRNLVPDEFRKSRSDKAALLWGHGATLRAMASGAFWTSVRNQAGVLMQRAAIGAIEGAALTAGGAKLAQMAGAPDQLSGPITAGGAGAGALLEVGKELLDIAKSVAEADMVIIWKHPGVKALKRAVPGRWLISCTRETVGRRRIQSPAGRDISAARPSARGSL